MVGDHGEHGRGCTCYCVVYRFFFFIIIIPAEQSATIVNISGNIPKSRNEIYEPGSGASWAPADRRPPVYGRVYGTGRTEARNNNRPRGFADDGDCFELNNWLWTRTTGG